MTRHPRTVGYWMRLDSTITALHIAKRMDTPAAGTLVRAADKLAEADPDDEAGWTAAADEYSQAERDFLATHRDTEVSYR